MIKFLKRAYLHNIGKNLLMVVFVQQKRGIGYLMKDFPRFAFIEKYHLNS